VEESDHLRISQKTHPFAWFIILILVLLWFNIEIPIGIQIQIPTLQTIWISFDLYRTYSAIGYFWGEIQSSGINFNLYSLSTTTGFSIITMNFIFWITIVFLIGVAVNFQNRAKVFALCALICEGSVLLGIYLLFQKLLGSPSFIFTSTSDQVFGLNYIILGYGLDLFYFSCIFTIALFIQIYNSQRSTYNAKGVRPITQKYIQRKKIIGGLVLIFFSLIRNIGALDFYYFKTTTTSFYVWGFVINNQSYTELSYIDLTNIINWLIFLCVFVSGVLLIICGLPQISYIVIKKMLKITFFNICFVILSILINFIGFFSSNTMDNIGFLPFLLVIYLVLIYYWYRQLFVKKSRKNINIAKVVD
jgi:hypothetical protein